MTTPTPTTSQVSPFEALPPLGDYASAAEIRMEVAYILDPGERLSVSQCATKHRTIRNQGGGFSGRWSTNDVPYLLEPMDVCGQRGVSTVIFAGPAQSAKTTALVENVFLHGALIEPADTLIVCPSEMLARQFSDKRISQMIADTPELSRRLEQDKILQKTFVEMALSIGYPSPAQLAMRPFARVVMTDYDRMDENVGGEGSAYDLASKRPATFGKRGKVVVEGSPGRPVLDPRWRPSTPNEAPPTTGILGLYNMGDRRRWQWPCPHCGAFFEGSFKDLHWPGRDAPDGWKGEPKDLATKTVMICPVNGCVIEPAHKYDMNQAGQWVAEGQAVEKGKLVGPEPDNSIVSFWLKGPAAAFQDWIDMVRIYLEAWRYYKRTGSEERLKARVGVDHAEAFVSQAIRLEGSPEASELEKRVEAYPLRKVPAGVRFLTAAVDVQKHRFPVLVRGWGPNLESWIIDRFELFETEDAEGRARKIDPAKHLEDWQLLLDDVIQARYPLAEDPTRSMLVARTAIDSAGAKGVTSQAYAFHRWLRDEKQLAGQAILTKGTARPTAPRVAKRFPDSRGRADRNADARGEIPVWFFQSNTLKDELANQLEARPGAELSVHLSRDLMDPEPPHSFFEELSAEMKDEAGRWFNTKDANEAWDLAVLTHVAAIQVGVEDIDWSAPPDWAAEHEVNSLVEASDEEQSSGDDTPPPAPVSRAGAGNFATDF